MYDYFIQYVEANEHLLVQSKASIEKVSCTALIKLFFDNANLLSYTYIDDSKFKVDKDGKDDGCRS